MLIMLLLVGAEIVVSGIYPTAHNTLIWEAAVLLIAILAIWSKPLLKRKVLSLAILTFWFGFVALGFLVRSELLYAAGLGFVCVLGLVSLIRKLWAGGWPRAGGPLIKDEES
jgi:hypothetical protein